MGINYVRCQMVNREQLWHRYGLKPRQLVRCRVIEHRGRFGVDVAITAPSVSAAAELRAFVDFVLLAEAGTHLTPNEFPPVGADLMAVTVDFMPNGELRLDARPSTVAKLQT